MENKNEAAKTAENAEAKSLDNLKEQEIKGEKIKGGGINVILQYNSGAGSRGGNE